MVKVKWKKALAAAVTAAMTMMAVPSMVFADEVEVLQEEVVMYEANEDEVSPEEAVEAEEIVVEETDETVDSAVVVDPVEEENVVDGDGPTTADWHKPVAYKVGDKVSGIVYDMNNNTPEGRAQGIYFDKRFYKFTVPKTGLYQLKANSPDDRIEFIISNDIEKYFTTSDWKCRVKLGAADPNLESSQKQLLAGQEIYIIVDGNCGREMDKTFEFTFSLVKEVKLFDRENPETILLDKVQTTTGELEKDFGYPNICFDENENLSAHNNYYKFEVTQAGRLNMVINSKSGFGLLLVEAPYWYSGGTLVSWTPGTVIGEGVTNGEFHADLIKGTYHFFVYSTNASDDNPVSDYSIKTEFKPIKTEKSKGEEVICDDVLGGSRNSVEDAAKGESIFTDIKYYAQSSEDTRTKTNWYKLVLTSSTKLYLSLSSTEIASMDFYIRDGISDASSISLKGSEWGITPERKAIEGKQLEAEYRKYTTVFPAGTYYIGFRKDTTGSYSFELSTGSKVKVTGVTLNKKETWLGLNGTDTLVATVKPANADNKSVRWEVVDDPTQTTIHLTPNEDGSCVIEGLCSGMHYKVKAIAASNKDIYAICDVNVLDQKISQRIKEDCENVVATQKVDLSGNEYFGSWGEEFNKDDKFLVEPAKAGKVSKGFFTAGKIEGEVTITRQIKAGKGYINSDKVKFELKQPQYKKDDKGKDKKNYIATYIGQEFDATACVDVSGMDVEITDWRITDKTETNFEVVRDSSGKATGKILCKTNGKNCKVTPCFGADKTPGNITFTLKTVTPKLSATKKLKQQTGQNFVLKLSNCTETSEIEWKFEADPTDTRVAVQTDAVTIEEVKADKPTKLQKKININKAVSGKIVATVDEHTYECAIEVVSPEIKKAAQTLKVGKAGAVGVKNTKIKDITWTTSDSSKVEIVDAAKGKIKAVAPGTATISAEIGGVTVSCEVTVTE